MEFEFLNFGPVDKGKIELGKFTIICGPNNVGKTYINYAIYSYFKLFNNLVEFRLSKEQIDELVNNGVLRINLTRYLNKVENILKISSRKFSQLLPSIFNVSEDVFKRSQLSIKIKDYKYNNDVSVSGSVSSRREEILNISKEKSLIF